MVTRPRPEGPVRGPVQGRGGRAGGSPREGGVGATRTRSGRAPALPPIALTSDGRGRPGRPRGSGSAPARSPAARMPPGRAGRAVTGRVGTGTEGIAGPGPIGLGVACHRAGDEISRHHRSPVGDEHETPRPSAPPGRPKSLEEGPPRRPPSTPRGRPRATNPRPARSAGAIRRPSRSGDRLPSSGSVFRSAASAGPAVDPLLGRSPGGVERGVSTKSRGIPFARPVRLSPVLLVPA